jgi:hypothetical protein
MDAWRKIASADFLGLSGNKKASEAARERIE